jgi:DNA-binding CsgD family transcriptional regulator
MADVEVVREITPLEERIIAHLGEGYRNADIADRLDRSMAQLRSDIGRLLGDLGLADRDALVAWRQKYPPPPLSVRITYRRSSGFSLGEQARRLLRRS